MKDIIDQIVQIDSVAYENKKKNEEMLNRKKQEYEELMKRYRDEKLAEAGKQSELIYKEYEEKEKREADNQETLLKKVSVRFENQFKKIEGKVLKDVMESLFLREG